MVKTLKDYLMNGGLVGREFESPHSPSGIVVGRDYSSYKVLEVKPHSSSNNVSLIIEGNEGIRNEVWLANHLSDIECAQSRPKSKELTEAEKISGYVDPFNPKPVYL